MSDKIILDEWRDAFREAALRGVPQIVGRTHDERGGFCALGWLNERRVTIHEVDVAACHLCGATRQTYHDYPNRRRG